MGFNISVIRLGIILAILGVGTGIGVIFRWPWVALTGGIVTFMLGMFIIAIALIEDNESRGRYVE